MTDNTIEKHLKDIEAAFRAACKAAYEQGGRDMRNKILHAAGVGVDQDVVPRSLIGSAGMDSESRKATKRAPRGLVGEIVELVLGVHPGLTLSEIEEKAIEADNRVAPKSISNELHRKKGEKYEQRGRQWYLASKETIGESPQTTAPFAWSVDKGDGDAPA